MSSSPEDVRLELKLKNRHVIDLFHALCYDGQFSLLISSTQSLVKLMNKVFCLEHHHVVLEYKQLNDVLKSDANLQLILVGNRQTCQAENIFYTELYDTHGKRETYYAFPHRQRIGSNFSLQGETRGGQQGSAGMKHLIISILH